MPKKIRVIELINAIADGGAETLVKDYAINLNKEFVEVFIVTENGAIEGCANTAILKQQDIKVYAPFISQETLAKKLLRKVQNRLIRPKNRVTYKHWYIKHIIRRIHPDVIHVHMMMLKYLLPIADELNGIKLLYTCHSLPNRYFNEEECREELIAARYLIAHNNLQFIALQNEMSKALNILFDVNNTIVLNNCVDLQRFRNVKETKAEIRQALGIPQTAFVVGHIGRFIWLKNQPFIVDIFNEVIKKHPHAFLLLVGAGNSSETMAKIHEYELEHKSLILEHRTDIPQLLKAMDVFVLPSVFEGLSIAAIEAQASGLRCVISSTIPKEIFFSENAIEADLSESASVWAEKLYNKEIKGRLRNDIEKYDVAVVMKEVQRIYSSL